MSHHEQRHVIAQTEDVYRRFSEVQHCACSHSLNDEFVGCSLVLVNGGAPSASSVGLDACNLASRVIF